MSSSKKAETVTWWIVTANGAGIAKIIAYRGLYTTGQKLTHRIHPAGVGVPLIFGMPKECTGTTDEFVAHMNESRRDYGKQMFGAGVQITASHIQVYTESTLISMCNDLQLGIKKRKATDAGAASDVPRDPATDLGLVLALEEEGDATDHTADAKRARSDDTDTKEEGEITDDSRLVGRVAMLEERNALLEKRMEQMEKRVEQISSETKPPPKMMMGYNFYAKPEEDLTDRYRNLFKFFGMSDAADDIVSASRITRPDGSLWPSHMARIEFGNSNSVKEIMDNKSCFLIRNQHDKALRTSLIQLKKLKQNGRDIDFQVPNDANYKTEPMKPAKPEPAAYVP